MSSQKAADASEACGTTFATTRWSLILDAKHSSSPEAANALSTLCQMYWYPLYVYARRRGNSAADAKDLTQEFFAFLLEKESLKNAHPQRGRFRSFLLTTFQNFASNAAKRQRALKRGGDRRQLSIDFSSGEQRYQFEPVDHWTPEKIYERRWALTLLDHVLLRLEREYAEKGKQALFECCKDFLVGADSSYGEIAEQLGMSEGAVRVATHRLRKRYRELLKQEVAATLAEPDDADAEMRHLESALRGETGR